ncbi:arsenate reductase family protein [Psychroflexus aestuariivivens]|uniref:arsenate reductase family protein n=1 Tax=Psychroflexus aestuariivivens TaxID=1795040 RepID=UPI000FDC944F|nr:ArsC family transcriptional regulator [Psychroflexus aestuariivivens]
MNDKDMGVIAKSENELKLYYHPDNRIAKQSIAVAEATNAEKHLVNLAEVKLTETQWAELANMLDMKPTELFNTEHDLVKDKLSDSPEMDENEALKVLTHNPEVLMHCIALRGNKAILVKSINDIMKLQEMDSKDAPLP